MATTHVPAACHCKTNTFQVAFVAAALPISIGMCHCNQCRHSTGQLHTSTIPIQGRPLSRGGQDENTAVVAELTNLRQFEVTPRVSNWFCRKCSALMFQSVGTGGPMWRAFPGVLAQIEGISKVVRHYFVADTHDGGLSDAYSRLSGAELPRYRSTKADESTLALGWKSEALSEIQNHPLANDSTLELYCHCRSININVLRPPKVIEQAQGHWALIPPTTDSPHRDFLYLASHCLCIICRLTSGSMVSSWLFVHQDSIIDKRTSQPIVLGGGTSRDGLLAYESSPGCFRDSCATCGARVFYRNMNRQDGIVGVAAGLINQEQEGSRAERFFAWSNDSIQPRSTGEALETASGQALLED